MTVKRRMTWIFVVFFIFVSAIFVFYSWKIEPQKIETVPVEIKLAGTFPQTKIVVLGDFHFSKNDRGRAEKIVQKTLALKPDAVCLLGDFTNRHSAKKSMPPEEVAKILGAFPNAGIPTFAVLGNHDAYIGRQIFTKTLADAGIRVFAEKDGETAVLKNGARFFFAGTIDAHSHFEIFDKNCVPENKTDAPCILLSHSPDVIPFLNDSVDLVFCGHTHGGQLRLPLVGAVACSTRKAGRKYDYGHHTLPFPKSAQIFITRGLGTSVLPLRFNCVPEIAEIILRPQPAGTENEREERGN